jgi:hypothetical protein
VKEGKQAEFLVHGTFPFALVERVGVCSPTIRARAVAAVGTASQPVIEVCPAWYF